MSRKQTLFKKNVRQNPNDETPALSWNMFELNAMTRASCTLRCLATGLANYLLLGIAALAVWRDKEKDRKAFHNGGQHRALRMRGPIEADAYAKYRSDTRSRS